VLVYQHLLDTWLGNMPDCLRHSACADDFVEWAVVEGHISEEEVPALFQWAYSAVPGWGAEAALERIDR
jgi:hypothetical protein